MIEQQFSADRLNHVLNHPRVRPWVASGGEKLDVSSQVANPNNILLMGEHGGSLCVMLQQGIYEIHTQVLPDGRGEWVADFAREALRWMFTRTHCYELLTRVPKGHLAARALCQMFGWRKEFTRPGEFSFMGRLVDVDIYALDLMSWSDPDMEDIGRQFHDQLHAAADKYGVTDPLHEDDPNHNQYVGMAMEMARHGQVRKAVLWYNRWALISRHAPITMLAENKVAIDLGLRLTINDGELEIDRAVQH